MTIDDALQFIHNSRWRGASASLDRVRQMLKELGNPQNDLRFLHVAGTNGKGSVCAIAESVLRFAGYKTGLFTSPYLHRFNERMRVNGTPISDGMLCGIVREVQPVPNRLSSPPTEFELVTVIALKYFSLCGCDIVILETGMGGRLDPTNVISAPECAVITSIGLDHMQYLGGTISEIAAEKAGIIKENTPVAAYESAREAMDVIRGACDEKNAPLVVAGFDNIELLSDSLSGQVFRYGEMELKIPLLGSHQLKNAAVALEAILLLKKRGYAIPDAAIEKGLTLARWPARFELIGERPFFIVDAAHNAQCAVAARQSLLNYFPGKKRIILIGMMRDKDAEAFIGALMDAADEFVCVTPQNPRALGALELRDMITKRGRTAHMCENVSEGIALARCLAGEKGAVCALGSLYLAGEVREHFGLS